MIRFKKVVLEGFGNIRKRYTYILDHPGITLLRGPNGKGKTTIFSGFMWVLTGYTLKNKATVETWPELRPKTFRGTQGIVKWKLKGSTYEVLRHKKFKGEVNGRKAGDELIIMRDGQEIPFEDKRAAQAYIYKLLGCSYEVFVHSIVFGQKMKRFIEEPGPGKKKVFDEIFDTLWIDVARKELQTRLADDVVEPLKTAQSKHSADQAELSFIRNNWANKVTPEYKKIKQSLKATVSAGKATVEEKPEKPEDKGDIIASMSKLKVETDELTQKLSRMEDPSRAKLKAELGIARTEGAIADLKEKVLKLVTKRRTLRLNKICPECGGKLKDQKVVEKVKEISDAIEAASNHIELEKETLASLNKSLQRANKSTEYATLQQEQRTKQLALANLVNKLADIDRRWDSYNRQLKSREFAKKALEKARESYKEHKAQYIKAKAEHKVKLKSLKARIARSSATIGSLEAERQDFDWAIQVLSNSGLKAYIFNTACSLVNERLTRYCENMAFKIEIGVDLQSHHKDFYATLYHKGVERIYNDLSGGEQQLVSVFIAFAINDVLSFSAKKTNILLLDEVFESLSEENIELVMNFIIEKSKDRSIHMITHSDTFYPSDSRQLYINHN